MKSLKNDIAEKISAVVGVDKAQLIDLFETPPSEDMGDLALPCFHFSKMLRKSPLAVAIDLAAKIHPDELLERAEAKGPYLNFYYRHDKVISDILAEISEKKEKYGRDNYGAGKTVVIDYSSPNIAKPFGIGHLRSTVIGASLKRIFEHRGYKVIGINHLGDWGTQFGKVILAYKLWGDEKKLGINPIEYLYDLYVRIHQEEEKDLALKERTREEFKKLESGDPENLALWKKFSELSRQEFDKIYGILGITFESVAGESFYNDKIASTAELLDKSGLLSESREATIVDLEKYNLPPLLIKKSDETTLYATRDLAAAIYRQKTYNFDKMLYVVGVAQSLHFKQFFKVLELLGFDWVKKCHHISFGWVKLGDEMMSTRKGNIVFLEDVISKAVELAQKIIKQGSPDLPDPEKTARDVGIGAVVFTDLAFRRDTDISFDWDRMLDFSGNSGPYLQYSYARISSIFRKYGKPMPLNYSPNELTLPEEYSLVKKLSYYPEIIAKAAEECEPFYISTFLLELCGLFNTYYQKYKSAEDRVLSNNNDKTEARLALVNSVRYVLGSGLSILGLTAPEMM